ALSFFFFTSLRPPSSTLFPTRRSSDLGASAIAAIRARNSSAVASRIGRRHTSQKSGPNFAAGRVTHRSPSRFPRKRAETCDFVRSEEHTSELQSPCNLVCRLLLEKKKK